MERKFNFKPSPHDARDLAFRLSKPMVLPANANKILAKLPQPLDQLATSSCVGHAVAQAIYVQRSFFEPPVMPSRLAIYYGAREIEGTTSEDAGCFIRNALKVASKRGAGAESLWSFIPPAKLLKAPTARYYKAAMACLVNRYERVPQSERTIKECLAKGWPIVCGIEIRESFMSQAVAKTGVVPSPKPTEAVIGWHAILIIGYNDARKAYLCRNSWGILWGDLGNFWLPYETIHNPATAADFNTLWTT